jgi:uncharacterized membrane protein
LFWAHLHPAIIHFVVGLGFVVLIRDILSLRKDPEAGTDSPDPVLEGWGGLVLLGVGTGWIALAHDTLVQNRGIPIPFGQIHEKMGVFFLALSTLRILGGTQPPTFRRRRFWIGMDLALMILLLGTSLMGEWLVFHEGLGLDRPLLQSAFRAQPISVSRSSRLSSPTDIRTKPSSMPIP